MTVLDASVIVAGVAAIGSLAWFFFKPRQAAEAKLEGGVQTVDITVKGGYSPNPIRVQSGTPVRLRFDRQENSDCTAKVVFPDFWVSKSWRPSPPPPSSCPPRNRASTGSRAG